jgi:hypothetical protein
LCEQFQPIFELCQFVMENSGQASLIEQTLATMLRFLSWIPIGYVFETDLVPTLVNKVCRPCYPTLYFPHTLSRVAVSERAHVSQPHHAVPGRDRYNAEHACNLFFLGSCVDEALWKHVLNPLCLQPRSPVT